MLAKLEFQREGEVEDGLAIVGVGVAALPDLHGSAQVLLGLLETSAAQVPKSNLVEAAHVVGVAAQGLLIVVEGRPRCVAVLFQMQACQVELVARLALYWRQSSLGRIRDGAHLIGLGMPGEEGHSLVRPFLVPIHQRRLLAADVEREVVQQGVFHVHHLCQHLLGRERHHLIIIVLAVGSQHQLHTLLRRGHDLEANAVPLVLPYFLIY